MSFFIHFPDTDYALLNGKKFKVTDIFRSVSLNDKIVDGISVYQNYTIDNLRPDQLSNKLYGSPDFYWTFFIINPQLRNGWPMGYETFENYINSKYKGKSLTAYRTDVNFGIDNSVLPGDDLQFNMISNGFEVGSILSSPSGAGGRILKRYPDFNTIAFEYTTENEFLPNELIICLNPNGTYNYIYDGKFIIRDWKDAPYKYVKDGVDVTNPTNLDYSDYIYPLYQFESDKNDSIKQIRVIRDSYIREFVDTFRDIING